MQKLKNIIRKIIEEHYQKISGKIIAYHGTPYGKFDKFSMRHRGKGADQQSVGDYGKGFYFTPNKQDAINYAFGIGENIKIKDPKPTLYTVELTMKNPFDMRLLSEVMHKQIELVKKFGIFNVPEEEYSKMFNEFGIDEEYYNFLTDVEGDIGDNWADWDIKAKIKQHGHDSLINYSGDEYVVYEPKQIKIIDIEELHK